MTKKLQTDRSRVINAALTVGVLLLVSSLLNLLREQLLSAFYGTNSAEATAIALILPLPELIFIIISGGALGSAFIPVFTRFFTDHKQPDIDGASAMFSKIVTLVLLAAVVVTGIASVIARPLFTRLFAERIAEQAGLLALLVPLFRIMLLAQVIFGVSGVVMVTLYARQKFLIPALAVVVYALGQIVGVVLLRPNVLGLAWGMVFGALGHLLIQLPLLRREGIRFRPKLSLADPQVRRVLWLMAPRTLGLAFSYLNLVFVPYIAQTMVIGSEAASRYAVRIMLTPQAFIGRALGTASFPTFADLAAREQYTAMQRMISDLLRLILFIGMPLTIVMVTLAQPLIKIVFERGEYNVTSTNLTASALVYYALAFIALSLIEILARAFFALEDTLTPVLIGAGQLVLMFSLSFWLGRTLFPSLGLTGVSGIALGYSLSNWAEVALLLFFLRGKMQGLNGRYLLAGSWRIGLAGGVMAGLIVLGWQIVGSSAEANLLTQIITVGIISTIGGIGYLITCYLLRLEELHNLASMVFARFGRK
ncbi:MAG TPA: murein biosynthesis integral membrane protein MurJ [Anaerolineae bacterium]|nr:murein biosynthesis integral membrane protein MurJ [Anaerolineae bacterium]